MIKKILFFALGSALVSGCATTSVHMVKNGYQVSTLEPSTPAITVNSEFSSITPPSFSPNTGVYLKQGIGKSVAEFLIINNGSLDFDNQFYGEANKSAATLDSSTESINANEYKTQIQTYDFRFNNGGPLRSFLDNDSRSNRPCGVVKTYTNRSAKYQIVYGQVVNCGTLMMSMKNFKNYRIADLVENLNESVKHVFDVNASHPSGELVSVSYSFPDTLSQGDIFEIFVNSERAAKFTLTGNFTLDELSTRVRVKEAGIISGKITWKSNSKPSEILPYPVKAFGTFNIPDKCDTTAEHKLRRKGNEQKILFNNHMSKNCYIDLIEFENESGKLVAELNPLITRNPYFHFTGVSGETDLKVNPRVHVD